MLKPFFICQPVVAIKKAGILWKYPDTGSSWQACLFTLYTDDLVVWPRNVTKQSLTPGSSKKAGVGLKQITRGNSLWE